MTEYFLSFLRNLVRIKRGKASGVVVWVSSRRPSVRFGHGQYNRLHGRLPGWRVTSRVNECHRCSRGTAPTTRLTASAVFASADIVGRCAVCFSQGGIKVFVLIFGFGGERRILTDVDKKGRSGAHAVSNLPFFAGPEAQTFFV